jgi:hypothetical protein
MARDLQVQSAEIVALYRKAKAQQWDAERDIDWSVSLDPANPLNIPDEILELHGTDLWRQLSDGEQQQVRRHAQSWQLSQILHAEQAGILCAGKIAQGEADLATKQCAAVQVMDEARHAEVYARLLDDNFGVVHPIDSAMKALVTNVLDDPRPDITNLGLQVLLEGLALAIFRRLQAHTRAPLMKRILAYVLKDEARHFAVGKSMFGCYAREFSEAERREREEFVCEASLLLHRLVLGIESWDFLELSLPYRHEMIERSRTMTNAQRMMFRQLVPTVREMGLLGPTTMRVFEELRVAEYASFPLADLHG